MNPIAKYPAPPRHFSPASKKWWKGIVQTYFLESHHLRLLQGACESWDRAQQAREVLKSEGLTFASHNGDVKPRPEVAVERDSMIRFARLCRELRLDDGPEDSRPPRLGRKD